jgi:hypothetical protein
MNLNRDENVEYDEDDESSYHTTSAIMPIESFVLPSCVPPPPDEMMSLSDSSTTGNKRVLVVQVVSNNYAPSQSKAKMYDDVFVDDNNLVSTITAMIDSNIP